MRQTQQLPILMELKPDRNLLDPNFNGYKLSLEKLPTYVVSIKTGVDRAQPSEQQYSLQHVKQFAVHNHIFSDPFNPFVVYIVDKSWAILRVSIDVATGRLDIISEVWRIPKSAKKQTGRFNVTVSFPDNGHAVISDGCETLYIVRTGDRKSAESEPWVPITTLVPFSSRSTPQFYLLDSAKYRQGNNNLIDILALRIDDKSDWKEVLESLKDSSLSGHSFLTILEWLTFQGEGADETKWILKSQRTLLGHSGTEYAYLEPGANGVYLASESRFHVVADSEKPIQFQPVASNAQNAGDGNKPEYVWSETMEEVKLWFRLPIRVTKRDVEVVFKRDSIIVCHKGKPVIEGPLFKTVSVEGSYWIIDTPKCLPPDAPEIPGAEDVPDEKQYKVLEIVLEKVEKEVLWTNEVVKGNACGEYVADSDLVESIHSRLAHLCSDKWGADPGQSDAYDPRQLEECDEYPADSSCLMRVDRGSQRISHTASLGSHQWLFNVRLEPVKAPAICIRHDVDGIVWVPKLQLNSQQLLNDNSLPTPETIQWVCEHVGTFSALGYVQASKQQRKYTLCSSDLSYVAICDAKKHIYVYRQPSKIESCLRNRRTGEQVTHVAKQLVISLDPPQDILGAYATPSYLYVLTPENFHAIRILAEEE